VTQEHIDIIYSTAPPFSNHLVAAIIARLTRKPLVTDFRDAWVSNPVRAWKYAPTTRQAAESLLERIVIRNSDYVVSTTQGITQDFRGRYSSEAAKKFVTITNGYDREELSTNMSASRKQSNKMLIVHTGYLRMERSPETFIKALKALIEDSPNLEEEMEVYLIGESDKFLDGKNIKDYITENGLEGIVKEMGHIPRVEATRYQIQADILLLIIGVVPREQVFTYGIASKVFDYMLVQKPILALADEGPVSQLIEETKIGVIKNPNDIIGIKNFLFNSLQNYKLGCLKVEVNKDEISRYDMENLTGKLAQLFCSCMQ
jgi:glycosyltransferase involved in cell wall biosynthesis